VLNAGRRGNKGHGCGDDLVSGANPKPHQGQVHGCRAGVESHHMGQPGIGRELPFKFRGDRAGGQKDRIEDFDHVGDVGFVKGVVVEFHAHVFSFRA